MTVLNVAQNACLKLGMEVPSIVFSATTREMLELQNAINEAAKIILQDYDWQLLLKTAQITGDGTTDAWPRPADYKRMIGDGNLWTMGQPFRNLVQVPSYDEWLQLDLELAQTINGRWIMFGNEIHIKPAREVGENVKYFYVSNLIVNTANTPDKTAFTADTDSFALDERLLTLCTIWNWKKDKGQDYAPELDAYEQAFAVTAGKDRGPRRILSGASPYHGNTRIAYPFGALGSI